MYILESFNELKNLPYVESFIDQLDSQNYRDTKTVNSVADIDTYSQQESLNEEGEMQYEWIKLNNISPYTHIADKWEVEDRSFMPRIRNAETGKIIPWSMSGKSFRTAYVTKKDGGRTSISSEVLSRGMDELHNDPFFRKEQRDKKFKRR